MIELNNRIPSGVGQGYLVGRILIGGKSMLVHIPTDMLQIMAPAGWTKKDWDLEAGRGYKPLEPPNDDEDFQTPADHKKRRRATGDNLDAHFSPQLEGASLPADARGM